MVIGIAGARTLKTYALLLLLLCPGLLLAQNPAGALGGKISDPSGLPVPNAKVDAVSSTGHVKAGVVHPDGSYDIEGLAPGNYAVRAAAKGFAPFEQKDVQVAAGKTGRVNISLQIAQEIEKVQVTTPSTKVSVNPRKTPAR